MKMTAKKQSPNWKYIASMHFRVCEIIDKNRFVCHVESKEIAQKICSAVNSHAGLIEALKKCRMALTSDMEVEKSERRKGLATKAWEAADDEIDMADGRRFKKVGKNKNSYWTFDCFHWPEPASYVIIDSIDGHKMICSVGNSEIANLICDAVNAQVNILDALNKCRIALTANMEVEQSEGRKGVASEAWEIADAEIKKALLDPLSPDTALFETPSKFNPIR